MRRFEKVRPKFKMNAGEETIMPRRSTIHSSCYDFFMPCDVEIPPFETRMISTDVKACMNDDETLLMFVRSSMGMKRDILLSNGTGVIDSDYYSNPDNDGNIGISLRNVGHETAFIRKGERVCQGMFVKFLTVDDEDEITSERTSGIGSTGR